MRTEIILLLTCIDLANRVTNHNMLEFDSTKLQIPPNGLYISNSSHASIINQETSFTPSQNN